MDKHSEQERVAFEAAMNERRFFPAELSFAMTKSPSGRDEYANSHLQSRWEGWIARARASQAPAPSPDQREHDATCATFLQGGCAGPCDCRVAAPATAASIDSDKFVESLVTRFCEKGTRGYDDYYARLHAWADARLASQSASAKDAADGERYRFLREHPIMTDPHNMTFSLAVVAPGGRYVNSVRGDEMDAAIDAARAAMTRAEHG